ncbi:MAG: hypothetical protein ACHP8B_05100 [Terriglobales bacterium]
MPPPILIWITLLPIVPAVILFKALPQASSGSVGGKVYGVTVKFGGPIALYFAIFWLVMNKPNIWNPPPAYQLWEVSGRVIGQNGGGLDALTPGDVLLDPPISHIEPNNGSFKIKFATQPGPNGGLIYPDLYVSHPGFIGAPPLHLDPKKLKQAGMDVNEKTQEIVLKEITLSQPPSYNTAANQAAPKPVAPVQSGPQ